MVSEKLCRELGIRADFEELCGMWDKKEVDAALRKMMEDLSVALVSAVNLLQPELIVLGYEAVYLPERYVNYLEELVNQRKFIRDGQRTVVKKAYFGAGRPAGRSCRQYSCAGVFGKNFGLDPLLN